MSLSNKRSFPWCGLDWVYVYILFHPSQSKRSKSTTRLLVFGVQLGQRTLIYSWIWCQTLHGNVLQPPCWRLFLNLIHFFLARLWAERQDMSGLCCMHVGSLIPFDVPYLWVRAMLAFCCKNSMPDFITGVTNSFDLNTVSTKRLLGNYFYALNIPRTILLMFQPQPLMFDLTAVTVATKLRSRSRF